MTHGRLAGHERPDLRDRYLVLGQHLEQDRLQGLVRAVDLVDQQHHGLGGATASSSGRGARNRSEKKTLSCAPIRSIAACRSGASATNWPIFSRRIWVYSSCLP